MGELKVDPAAVHASGVELHQVAQTLHAELSAADEQIAASHAGWVGQSAQALAAKAAEWREATQTHHSDLTTHGHNFVQTARAYRGVDDEAADQVEDAGSAIGPAAAGPR